MPRVSKTTQPQPKQDTDRQELSSAFPDLLDSHDPKSNLGKRLVDLSDGNGDGNTLSRRTQKCGVFAALLASSDANMLERAHPRLHDPVDLQRFEISRSDVVAEFGVPSSWTRRRVEGDEIEESSGIDGGNQSSLIVEPNLALDVASFLRLFLSYAAPPDCEHAPQFNETGLQALAILVEELVMDMMRNWKQTGAPLGKPESTEVLRRAVIAQINGAALEDFGSLDDHDVTRAVSFVETVISSLFSDSEEELHVGDVVNDILQEHFGKKSY